MCSRNGTGPHKSRGGHWRNSGKASGENDEKGKGNDSGENLGLNEAQQGTLKLQEKGSRHWRETMKYVTVGQEWQHEQK
jgi:hypothetical protein